MFTPGRIAAGLLLMSVAAMGSSNHAAFAAPRASHVAQLSLIHAGILSVGSDTTYPPMESKDLQHGGYTGADVDLANALARAMGLKGARIVPTTFSSIIPALQRHNFDVIMSSMNDTPARRQQITFVDYMRLTAAEAILVPTHSAIHASSYAGVCGHTISVQAGTAELDDLNTANKSCKSKIDIKSYSLDTDAFQALASGHVDAYTTDLPVGLFYVKAHSGAVRLAGKPFGSGARYGIGIAKNAPSLKAAITAALHKIHVNGQYIRILKKYGLSGTAM
jgi:polar amino acid transport system substrate-binding protein